MTSNARGMSGGGCLSFDLTGTLQLCLWFMASPFIFIQSEAPIQFINKKVINYERDDGKDKLPPGMSLSRQKLLLLYRARLLNITRLVPGLLCSKNQVTNRAADLQ